VDALKENILVSSEQLAPMSATRRAQFSQNLAWPHSTKAKPSIGANKQTSLQRGCGTELALLDPVCQFSVCHFPVRHCPDLQIQPAHVRSDASRRQVGQRINDLTSSDSELV